MRTLILILIILIVAAIAAVATGFVNINQIRGARAPDISATTNGVTAKGGQAPAFDVETGSVKVGAKDATVKVPSVEVQAPQNRAAPVTNNAQ
ncbi:hypothetical protein [Sphingomonas sp. URHD0057]|uniref:hypothetical protein n=1 Tax=Sphingomonas sp. URHD0057 TaxID=1380389 RepID=UPI000686016A|nr:hypothetical protein [Sphingomonas sp. URHD0057]